ncbi:Gfo/Idh/MocA family oxidoreductase [candidate division KSB1 bacterium]|nr:Gfo/Idh/MocA family oxidoreductase [candidate division KSB1 bacterium]
MKKNENNTRRDFIKKTALTTSALALGSTIPGGVLGANDKIRVGFIGVGNRGSQLLEGFMTNPDVEVAALCDLYEPYLQRDRSKVAQWIFDEVGDGRIPKMGETFTSEVKRYKDFRKLLEQKDIDAVCIATPDHWHAVQTIMALDAGKDVYVEKPLTITIHEGRRMVEAQKRTGQIVQVGLNRRGSKVYQKLAQMIQEQKIGEVSISRAYRISNMYPDGIGSRKPVQTPKDFDWDMWLGPREFIPFQTNIFPYKFRWWSAYSSQMGNWGVHYMDTIRWLLNEKAPVAISAHGSNYIKDDRTIPDTMEVTFEMGSGVLISFSIYEACGGQDLPYGEIEFRGTKGTFYSDDSSYRIEPSRNGQFQDWTELMQAEEFSLEKREDPTKYLIRNFLDNVKSRGTVWCPLEEGHRSTSFAHLANIAYETKKRLEWDAEKELFTNCDEANKLLHYQYRGNWKL